MRPFASIVLVMAYVSAFTIGAWPAATAPTAAASIGAADHEAVSHVAEPSTAARSVAAQGDTPPYVSPYAAPTPCQTPPTSDYVPPDWSTAAGSYKPFTKPLESSPAIANPIMVTSGQQPVAINVTQVSPLVQTQRSLDLTYQLVYNNQYPGPTVRVTSDVIGQPYGVITSTAQPSITQMAITNSLPPIPPPPTKPTVPFPYITTHLHGGHTPPEHDGHPSDLLPPMPTGRNMTPASHTYTYTNDQQGQILWYHDHADMNTNPHVAEGLYAFYIIQENPGDPNAQYLPRSPNYDIPLGLQVLTANGGTVSFVAVDGYDSPVLNVEPRWYRFRLLNASAQQSISLTLCAANSYGQYVSVNPYAWIIGTDGGLLKSAIQLGQQPSVYGSDWLDMFQAERYDMLINFGQLQADGYTSIYFGSVIRGTDGCVQDTNTHPPVCQNPSSSTPAPQQTPMMVFDVNLPLNQSIPDTTNPQALYNGQWDDTTTYLQSLHPAGGTFDPTPDRLFTFEQAGSPFVISGQQYDQFRLTNSDTVTSGGVVTSYPAVIKPAQVQANAVEIWEVRNVIPCQTHPVHVHDIEFQVIAVNGVPLTGQSASLSAARGWKDVFVLPPVYNATNCPWVPNNNLTDPSGVLYTSITFIGQYESHWVTATPAIGQTVPWYDASSTSQWTALTSGTYVFHCHNLSHEDDVMMGQFSVLPPTFNVPGAGSVPGGGPERALVNGMPAPSAPWGGQPPGSGPPDATRRMAQPRPGMYGHSP